MGTDEPSKQLFGLTLSKEFMVALGSIIFGAGINYAKLNELETDVAEVKKSLADDRKSYYEVFLSAKLLEHRVQLLEQKNQPH